MARRTTGELLGEIHVADRTYKVHRDDRGAELRDHNNRTAGTFRVLANTPLILHGPRYWNHDQYRQAVDQAEQIVNPSPGTRKDNP